MIVINKDTESSTLILPPLYKTYTTHTLNIYSEFTRKEYTIDLGVPTQSNSRFSRYRIEQVTYSQLETGEYNFTFKANDELLTLGVLVITTAADKPIYESITAPVESNDFYVYNTN